MAAPTLRPIAASLNLAPNGGEQATDVQRFEVVQAGEFLGRSYRCGEVLVVGGRPRMGEPLVLLARGMGRPRMGSLSASGLRGPVGELCSRQRWSSAGRVLSVERGGVTVSEAPTGQLGLSWSLAA